MEKIVKTIIVVMMITFGLACGAFLSIRFFKEKSMSNKKEINSNVVENMEATNGDTSDSKNTDSDKNEYKIMDIYSVFVDKMYANLPKELQFEENKTSEQYITFAAVSALAKDEDGESIETEEGFSGYSSSKVLEKAKSIYGENATILKENTELYVYKEDKDIIALLPYSSGSASDYQIVKEVREYSDRYELDMYLVTINYSEEETLYISSKDTLELIRKKCEDEKEMKNSFLKYTMKGAKVNIEDITKEIPNDLPIATYIIPKIDERGLKYYLKEYKIN